MGQGDSVSDMFPFTLTLQKVEVLKFELDKAVELVRGLACTDIACKNATANGWRLCQRCVALATITGLYTSP